MYFVSLRCDLENFDLKSIGQQFDVILIEPPLEEYARSYGVTNTKFWEWEKIMALDIGAVWLPTSIIRKISSLYCVILRWRPIGHLCSSGVAPRTAWTSEDCAYKLGGSGGARTFVGSRPTPRARALRKWWSKTPSFKEPKVRIANSYSDHYSSKKQICVLT